MKDILIIFMILLVLLMLISTFGGSIRPTERFVEIDSKMMAPPSNYEPMPPSDIKQYLPQVHPMQILQEERVSEKFEEATIQEEAVVEPFDNSDAYATI